MWTFSSSLTRPTACAPRKESGRNDESLNWDFWIWVVGRGVGLRRGDIYFANPFLPSRPHATPSALVTSFEKQTTVRQILSKTALPEKTLPVHILTNENPFSFCLRKRSAVHCGPPSPVRLLPHNIFRPLLLKAHNTHTVCHPLEQHNPFFGLSFSVSKQISLASKQSLSYETSPHTRRLHTHVHLFSRQIQKQRSEQPSLYSSHDGEHIDFGLFLGRGVEIGGSGDMKGDWSFLGRGHLDGNYGTVECYRRWSIGGKTEFQHSIALESANARKRRSDRRNCLKILSQSALPEGPLQKWSWRITEWIHRKGRVGKQFMLICVIKGSKTKTKSLE